MPRHNLPARLTTSAAKGHTHTHMHARSCHLAPRRTRILPVARPGVQTGGVCCARLRPTRSRCAGVACCGQRLYHCPRRSRVLRSRVSRLCVLARCTIIASGQMTTVLTSTACMHAPALQAPSQEWYKTCHNWPVTYQPLARYRRSHALPGAIATDIRFGHATRRSTTPTLRFPIEASLCNCMPELARPSDRYLAQSKQPIPDDSISPPASAWLPSRVLSVHWQGDDAPRPVDDKMWMRGRSGPGREGPARDDGGGREKICQHHFCQGRSVSLSTDRATSPAGDQHHNHSSPVACSCNVCA